MATPLDSNSESLTAFVQQSRFLALLFFESDADANRVFKRYFDTLHTLTLRYAQAGLLRDDIDPRWVTALLIYNQLGTVFLSGPMTEIIGQDLYSLENSTERTRAFIEIAKHGVFKDEG